MKEINALELRKKFAEVMDAVRYQKEPWIVKKNGRSAIVLVELETYRALQRGRDENTFIEEYSDARMAEFLAEDKADKATLKVARKSLGL